MNSFISLTWRVLLVATLNMPLLIAFVALVDPSTVMASAIGSIFGVGALLFGIMWFLLHVQNQQAGRRVFKDVADEASSRYASRRDPVPSGWEGSE